MERRDCPICASPLSVRRLDADNTLLRCGRCGHVVRSLQDCPAGARSAVYGGAEGLDAVRLWLTRRRVRRLVPAGGRIFELGYGSGALLRRLQRDGYTVGGIDSGQAGLAADVAAGDATAQPALRHGDATQAELLPGEAPYDAVLAVHVVEHVPDPLAVLRAAGRLLAPGGRLLLITPSADSRGLSLFGAAWWMLEDPTHIAFFSPQSMRLALAASGFCDVRIARPALESLSCEAASVRRRRRTGAVGGPGVLGERATLALAVGSLPVDVAARAVSPRLRPAMLATARWASPRS